MNSMNSPSYCSFFAKVAKLSIYDTEQCVIISLWYNKGIFAQEHNINQTHLIFSSRILVLRILRPVCYRVKYRPYSTQTYQHSDMLIIAEIGRRGGATSGPRPEAFHLLIHCGG